MYQPPRCILPFSLLVIRLQRIQVSHAIRRGYVPEKSQTADTKTGILGLI
jgi:hypothetical protein